MKMSGQGYKLARLYLGKGPLVSTEQETRGAPEPVWTFSKS